MARYTPDIAAAEDEGAHLTSVLPDTLAGDFEDLHEVARAGREHLRLGRAWWVFDYLLFFAFVIAGPLYYIASSFHVRELTLQGRVVLLSLQLAIHFCAASMFMTNHFVAPRTHHVMAVMMVYRLVLVLWAVLCVAGFWPLRWLLPGFGGA